MSGILQLGYDYTSNETRAVSVDTNGKMDIDVQVEDLVMKANDGNDGAGTDRTVKCDANGVLEVNASSAALPTGASTLGEQQAQTALLTAMDADTSALAGCVGGSELQVDIVSSALPSGAATESTLSALEAHQTDGNQIAQIKANTNKDGSGTSYSPVVDSDGHLQVDVLSGGGGGIQHAAGSGIGATPTGTLAIGKDGSNNARAVATDTSGHLQIDVLSSVLPTSAATETTLATLALDSTLQQVDTNIQNVDTNTISIDSSCQNIDTNTVNIDTSTTNMDTTLTNIDSNITTCDTSAVDIVSSALPSGAATEATLANISVNSNDLAGCVGGTELQCDIVSSALPAGAATSAAQSSGNASLATINGKLRTSANSTSSQSSIAVSSSGKATSSTINVSDNGKFAVAVKDNSGGFLHFIIQQSYDGSNWFGEPLAGGGSPSPNANEMYEADNSTSTGFWFLTNSDGYVPQGGGGGGGGSLGIAQYAQYVRVQAFDTAGSATTFDVHWYLTNSA